MNPGYIQNSLIDNTLNKYSYRKFPINEEPYFEMKKLNNAKQWSKIIQPNDLNKPLKTIYHWSLPYNHGFFNDRDHYNTYSTRHNYISPAYRINELFPNVGTMQSVMKNRG